MIKITGDSKSVAVLLWLVLSSTAAAADTPSAWSQRLYVDAGYTASDNQPENQVWRSKSTTFKLDSPQLNMALGVVSKEALPTSRWGMELGLQGGVDTEQLVGSPPVTNADELRHLYRANASYLLDAGSGLLVAGGLINSYVGYESFLAIENPNYTRAYILDTVPYFLVGASAAYSPSPVFDYALFLVTGYNYLANPNDSPSFGLQLAWQPSNALSLTQNVYYGPDQADTSVEFWRFLSDTIIEWKSTSWTLAAALDVVTEKNAELPGQPRQEWLAAAFWANWQIADRWSLAFRPELVNDPDGLATGIKQDLRAFTTTLKYALGPVRDNRLVLSLEYRVDSSTGEEGGFHKGADNDLVEVQNLLLLGLMWSFDH